MTEERLLPMESEGDGKHTETLLLRWHLYMEGFSWDPRLLPRKFTAGDRTAAEQRAY